MKVHPSLEYLFSELSRFQAHLALHFSRRQRTFASEPGTRANILVVLTTGKLGDTVLTTAFCSCLRSLAPGSRITVVTTAAYAALLQDRALCDEVISFDPPRGRPLALALRPFPELAFANRLRRSSFDLAFVPHFDVDYHAPFIALLSGATERWGFSESSTARRSGRARGMDALFTHVVKTNGVKHEAARSLELLEQAFEQAIEADAWHPRIAGISARRTRRTDATAGVGLFLAPYAAQAKRCWPLESCKAMIELLSKRCELSGLMCVPAEAEAAAREMVGDSKLEILAGNVEFSRLLERLQHCDVAVTADSGLMHLASAAGIPVVEISCHPRNGQIDHSNSPARFGPRGVPNIILQPESASPPCTTCCAATTSHCIRQISPQEATAAVECLLGRQQFAMQSNRQ